jgi:hypothetical protein
MDDETPDIDQPDTGSADVQIPEVDEPEQTPKAKAIEQTSNDAMERYSMKMQNMMNNQQHMLRGIHAYSRVMHRHMTTAARHSGHLPAWFHHARAVMKGMGLHGVGHHGIGT